jgi:hypothetical protein
MSDLFNIKFYIPVPYPKLSLYYFYSVEKIKLNRTHILVGKEKGLFLLFPAESLQENPDTEPWVYGSDIREIRHPSGSEVMC